MCIFPEVNIGDHDKMTPLIYACRIKRKRKKSKKSTMALCSIQSPQRTIGERVRVTTLNFTFHMIFITTLALIFFVHFKVTLNFIKTSTFNMNFKMMFCFTYDNLDFYNSHDLCLHLYIDLYIDHKVCN